MIFISKMKEIAEAAGDMLFPRDAACAVCGNELDGTNAHHPLCGKCPIEYNKDFCLRCGRKTGSAAEYCEQCIGHGKYSFDYARSPVVFNDTARLLIHALKYGEAKYLTAMLAKLMAQTATENALSADYISFVPLHKKRQKRRGYNQSELLAEELSKLITIPKAILLKKTVHTKNLAKLSKAERISVIENTFSAVTDIEIKKKRILLIDDVFTTGATADECARVLKKAGAETVVVLTFASVFISPQADIRRNKLKKLKSAEE